MPSYEAPALLGYLEEDECDKFATDRYEILDGQELLIGRDDRTCDIVLTDPTVSNQHLQIYTIVYAEENHQRIFTYAKDLSTNGSYWRYKHGNVWKELPIGKGKAVLLSDGDKVRLCNGSTFTFQSIPQPSQCLEEVRIGQDKDVKLFINLFRIMGQKLGSGAYGEVWMAVDNFNQRQVACKIVKLNKPFRNASPSRTIWREVDLLKDLSHLYHFRLGYWRRPNVLYRTTMGQN